ncbi:hypothetical protein H6F75_14855 [Nodosilinea sp. FACHB-131]|uniref:hypothetical protein n=1 Tax=Cyanophyceae TaxID=3028117 RepID=UPI0016827ADD|nr:hypothetical protein [Nodosilinea sp. FACHB-131]MBD1874766.1 hypothetical protein [Nodosilinea sp. FACHB-131]
MVAATSARALSASSRLMLPCSEEITSALATEWPSSVTIRAEAVGLASAYSCTRSDKRVK